MAGSFDSTRVVIDGAKLAELMRSPQGPVVRRLLEDGELVKAEAQRRVGVHTPDPWGRPKDRRPGTLRDSIVKRVTTGADGGVAVEVGSADRIALLHHEGTVPHPIHASRAPVAAGEPERARLLVFWNRAGQVVRTPSVQHPGTSPNRYLTDSLAVLRGRY